MTEEEQDNKRYLDDAKIIVNMLFDTKKFKESITRPEMEQLDEYIAFLLKSKFDSYIRLQAIIDSVNKLKNK